MSLKGGFYVLNVQMGGSVHQLFVKAHKSDEVADSSTLFVGNVDLTVGMGYDDIDSYLRELLEGFGDINGVSVSAPGSKPRDDGVLESKNLTSERSRYAHVLFAKKKSVANCIKSVERGDIDAVAVAVGKKWHTLEEKSYNNRSKRDIVKDFQWRDCGTVNDLKEEVDEYMKEFEEEEETERLDKIRKSREMDDDGFMPVRAKKKVKRTTDNNLKRKSGSSRSRGEKKSKELTNFYRFQMREEKKETLQSLREQFEKDKERVARMKADRRFKPF